MRTQSTMVYSDILLYITFKIKIVLLQFTSRLNIKKNIINNIFDEFAE